MQYSFFKNKYIYLGLLILTVSLLFITMSRQSIIFASRVETSSDVIAVRVMPNPEHYSALRWYQSQGFSGSPEVLTVDGYEAVRDGRTVYVNVGNVSGNDLYTNIYLISYNQDAGPATKNILSQILKHWKFNFDLSDDDKAKATRDVKRLAQINDAKDILENYKNKNGYYPTLNSGSYVASTSISTWPSWNTLGLPIDPINKLNGCPEGYNSTTCWNETNGEFAWSIDLIGGGLPANNYVSIYKSINNGIGYSLCSFKESRFNIINNNNLCEATTCEPVCYNECGYDSCGNDTCGNCGAGESCFQNKCYAACTTGPSCHASLTNAYVVPGYCASGQCYQCLSGYTWDGTAQQCYKCLSGYLWTGSACEVPVTSCVSDGYCDGNCPVNCTADEDADCGGAGCQGDGNCDIVNECSVNGGDCDLNDCCGNGVCDAGVGEDVNNCSDDCGVAINPCVFSSGFFNLSCLFN